MLCPYCRFNIILNSLYCPSCGQKLPLLYSEIIDENALQLIPEGYSRQATFKSSLQKGIKNVLSFSGRASLREFIYIYFTTQILQLVLTNTASFLVMLWGNNWPLYICVVLLLYIMLLVITTSVRRLHDTGHSGWWILMGLIPIIGWLYLLVLLFKRQDLRSNAYGSIPIYPIS